MRVVTIHRSGYGNGRRDGGAVHGRRASGDPHGADPAPRWNSEMTRRENLIRTVRRDGPLWVPYRYDGSLTMLWPPLTARPREGGTDDWGVRWLATGTDEGSYPEGTPVLALHEVSTCRAPDTDFDAVAATLRRDLTALRDEDTLVIVRNEVALFERATHLLGMTEFLMACAEEPRAVHAIFDTIADYQVDLAGAMMAAGVAGVRFTDD